MGVLVGGEGQVAVLLGRGAEPGEDAVRPGVGAGDGEQPAEQREHEQDGSEAHRAWFATAGLIPYPWVWSSGLTSANRRRAS